MEGQACRAVMQRNEANDRAAADIILTYFAKSAARLLGC